MPIILVANQKGGTSKSTTAVNFAAYLANKSWDVLLLDADRQPSVSGWWAERKLSHPDAPKIHSLRQYDDLYEPLLDLESRYTYVVVDCAGRDSVEMRSAMTVPGVVMLMPFKPSSVDMDTLEHMSEIIHLSRRRVNRNLIAHAFLSIAPTNSQIKETEMAREAILQYPEISLLDTVIHDRKTYRDAFAIGLGVVELKGKSDSEVKARQEITALVEEVLHGA